MTGHPAQAPPWLSDGKSRGRVEGELNKTNAAGQPYYANLHAVLHERWGLLTDDCDVDDFNWLTSGFSSS